MVFGYDQALYAVRLEHRGGAAALDAGRAAIVWSGVQQVASAGSPAGPGEIGVIVDGRAMPDLAAEASGGPIQLVLPMSDAAAQFRLASGDDFGAHVERFGPRIAQVEVRWSPDLDPDAKKAQALELTRLSAWLHETDRALLVDLEVPGRGEGAAAEDEDHLLKAIRELREVGVEPDLWALPSPRDAVQAAAVADLVGEAGRDAVGVLVRDDVASQADALASLRMVAGVTGYRGFVFGPAIWSDVVARRGAGDLDDEAATVGVADRLRQAITAVQTASGASGASGA